MLSLFQQWSKTPVSFLQLVEIVQYYLYFKFKSLLFKHTDRNLRPSWPKTLYSGLKKRIITCMFWITTYPFFLMYEFDGWCELEFFYFPSDLASIESTIHRPSSPPSLFNDFSSACIFIILLTKPTVRLKFHNPAHVILPCMAYFFFFFYFYILKKSPSTAIKYHNTTYIYSYISFYIVQYSFSALFYTLHSHFYFCMMCGYLCTLRTVVL